MQKEKVLNTLEEIKAISDPYRIKILDCIGKTSEAKTVKEVADALGEVPAKVYYHIKKLEKVGILELSHTKEINGIVAKYYCATAESFTIGVNTLKEPISKAVKGYSASIISNLYDDSKSKFLNELENHTENLSSLGIGLSTTIYLTKEEDIEFKALITDFIKNHGEKGEGKNEHHVFFVDTKIHK